MRMGDTLYAAVDGLGDIKKVSISPIEPEELVFLKSKHGPVSTTRLTLFPTDLPAENLGYGLVNFIASNNLCHVPDEEGSKQGYLWVWAENAAEQIGQHVKNMVVASGPTRMA